MNISIPLLIWQDFTNSLPEIVQPAASLPGAGKMLWVNMYLKCDHMEVSENRSNYPVSLNHSFKRISIGFSILNSKPSILGYPHLWKPLYSEP